MTPVTPSERKRPLNGERVMLVACTALLLVARLVDPWALGAPRVGLFDLFQRLAPRENASSQVVVVDIDEASIARYGQWPWPRDLLARLASTIGQQGPRVIGFDILFAEVDRLSQPPESHDQQFARSLSAAKVVLGAAALEVAIPPGHPPRLPSLIMIGGDAAPHLRQYAGLVGNLELLETAASGLGLISVELDRDGVLRRVPAVARVNGAILPALEIEMLRIAAGAQLLRIVVTGHGIDGVAPADSLVRTDPRGRIWLYYALPDRSRYVSAAALLAGEVDPLRLSGKYVLVGSTASGLHELRMTPLGVPMRGVEVRAQFLESLLSGASLNRPPWALAVELAAVLAIGLIIVGLRRRLTGWRSLLFVALAGGGTAVGSWYAFTVHRLLLDASYPLLSAAALALVIAVQNVRAVRQASEAAALARETRLRELQAELSRVSHRTALGHFGSALAHEITQPLGVIGNFLRASRRLLARPDNPPTADVLSYVNQAIDQVDRASAIIDGLRTLVGTGHTARAAADINAAVDEAMAIAFLDRGDTGVTVVARLAADLPPVLISRIQIQEVVLNLVRNAIEAMAVTPHRELVVETRRVDDGSIEVAVGDSGPGLPPEVEARLFEPFVGTKDTGMGVGLSICRSIVEAHDGRLVVERNAGGGSTFRFTLPLAPAARQADQA